MFAKARHLIGLFLAAGDHLLSVTICIFTGWEASYRCSKAQRKPKLVGFQAEKTASIKDVGLQISATRFKSLTMQADAHR